MKRISTVEVIDNLAEITRYHDREILERSLTATLAELVPSQEFRLYRIVATSPTIEIALLSLVRNGMVITERVPAAHAVSPELSAVIGEVVHTGGVVDRPDGRTPARILAYPFYDKEQTI